jgi:anti-sigma regulatory factor (Ser/Thr protein kinase)
LTTGVAGVYPIAEIAIPADAGAFRDASNWLAEAARSRGIPDQLIERLDLCLNEALANVLAYGGPTAHAESIRLSIQKTTDHEAVVAVEDAGIPFDPTAAEAKPRASSLATAEAGGHGLLIIRSFADFVTYQLKNQRNILRFGVRWAPAS